MLIDNLPHKWTKDPERHDLPSVGVLAAFVLCGWLLACLSDCSGLEPGDPVVRITGRTVDAQTDEGIDSVFLTSSPSDTGSFFGSYSDTAGYFCIEEFPHTTLTLYAKKSGYSDLDTLLQNADEDIDGLILRMQRLSR